MIGQALSHFKITAKLGEGGMGVVYRAEDTKLGREVALKILPPELMDRPDRVKRFELEAKSASALSHPHIVTIYEIGTAELEPGPEAGDATPSSVHYIAMELVDGVTFKDKIHRERAPLRDLLRWLAQAADGLAKAHAAGILHRDLKPDNIMVTRDGYAKVLDFGLAKLTEPMGQDGTRAPTIAAEQTAAGAVLGTVGYMSPEQVQGLAVDHRSDMFSLGCVLYEAAARQRPFKGETAVDTMHQILRSEPASVREMSPETPLAVQRIIHRTLAKDPERRYQSMKDLALELADLVEEFDQLTTGSDVPTGSGGSLQPIALPASPRRLFGRVAAVVGAIALGALLIMVLRGRGPTAALPTPLKVSFARLTSARGLEVTPSLSPDARFVVYAGGSENEADLFLLRVGGQNPINLTKTPGSSEHAPSFSPDGEVIAFASDNDGLFTMGATGETVRRLTTFGNHPSWSPDGMKIVFSSVSFQSANNRVQMSELWTIDSEGGEPELIQGEDAIQPSWSPSGERIAFWGIRGSGSVRDIATIPAAGGEPVWVTDDAALDWNPAWAPDGQHLYFASDRGGSMNLWRIAIEEATGEPLGEPEPVTTPSSSIGAFSLSADGSKLCYVNRESTFETEWRTFDPDTLELSDSPQIVSTTRNYGWASFSPSGEWIALSSWGQSEELYLIRPDGSETRQLTEDVFRDRGPSWLPDGKSLVFYSDRSGSYEAWRIDTDGSNLQQVTDIDGRYIWPRWSPNGDQVVMSFRGPSALIDVTGPLPATDFDFLPTPEDPDLDFSGLVWSHDGRQLAGSMGSKQAQRNVGIGVHTLGSSTIETVFMQEPGYGVGGPEWLSDGKRVMFELESPEGGRTLVVLDIDSLELHEVTSLADETSWQSIAPDDSRLILRTIESRADLWLASFE